ncbi:MAG: hypothetical protein LRY66_05395, partial [Saccharospirillaceae bacterium]|nr:hypothetical protein [Saccharospirillaceae bacterium]
MRIRHRLILMAALPALLASVMFFYVWIQMPVVVNNATRLFEQRMQPVWLLSGIRRAYAANVVDVAHQSRAQMLLWDDAARRLQQAREQIENNWQQYLNNGLTPAEQEAIRQQPDAHEKSPGGHYPFAAVCCAGQHTASITCFIFHCGVHSHEQCDFDGMVVATSAQRVLDTWH